MSQSVSPEGARVRWLVAGAFTPSPSGRRFLLTSDSFAAELAKAAAGLRATVPDRLGGAEHRTFELSFDKLRAFQVMDLIAAIPELKKLQALTEGFMKADPSRPLTPEEGAARISEVVGAGKLSTAVSEALGGKPAPAAPAPTPAPAASGGDDLVGELLASAESSSPTATAKAGVDAFLKAVAPKAAGPARMSPDARRAVRDAIELALINTTKDLLAAEPVAQLEANWRGLKFLLEQCPTASGIALEVVDVEPAKVSDALEQAVNAEPFERPDVCFVVDATDDVAQLRKLASIGEEAQVPVVVAVTPALLGTTLANLSTSLDDATTGTQGDWAELRKDDSTRWLCPVLNRTVVASEKRGVLNRASFASPTFAVAAMLSASFQGTSGFARITGQTGGLRAPGTWEPSAGKDAGSAYPTESFISIRVQTRLSELGILGVGSGRNTDMLLLSVAPMACSNPHVMPLPAQILTGRIVRFAVWVRDQLPAGSSAQEMSALFSQAAEVFLFGGSPELGKLEAQLVPGEGGRQLIKVAAAVKPEQAGTRFQLEFSLPTRQ
ncbi:type VI secretion system contractile sheath domain-containing protein [Hyalangium versicolor]|uniref:type VI secretion system contractile sheath domain-containing protein n=1 Tax=Hyalangium versicolor TaxID=2861190 RepID=UPI00272C43F7|nr:type VI secretion system contractile sheath large subunit [Hyalangium versicolor]